MTLKILDDSGQFLTQRVATFKVIFYTQYFTKIINF